MSTTGELSPDVGRALETNFIIEKFQGLTPAFQRLIYEAIQSNPRSVVYGAGGLALLDLAASADSKELTDWVNREFGTSYCDWVIWPDHRVVKAASLARYFVGHCRFDGEKFLIEPMNFQRE